MRSYPHSSRNAFSASFLKGFEQQDEPPTGPEADAAGPWFVEPIPGLGFGLFRAGESLTRGFRPAAVFPDRWLALLAAAVLPATGRDPLLRLNKDADAEGYGVTLDDGALVGHFELFDETLLEGMNVAIGLIRSPWALAFLLEAAGPLALRRCGAILDRWVTRLR
ncbi:MAG TPA: hypothetical protein VGX68_09285 [Thermoanaerobaculia bacterium]|jgi:hypothetical protein|nr:hypothetical protein [Thermoanaerobaculia bacterium]